MKHLSLTLRAVSLLTLLALTLAPWGATSAAPPPQAAAIQLEAYVGFDGYYKTEHWVPVRVVVANTGPEVQATLRVQAGNVEGAQAYTRDVVLPTQSRRQLYFYIALESYHTNILVDLSTQNNLFTSNTRLAMVTVPIKWMSRDDVLFGIVANTPSAFNVLQNLRPLGNHAYTAQLTFNDLPPNAAAWEALDGLIFSDVDTGALLPEQQTALNQWVSAGGKLLVTGGPSWQKTAAGLTDLLPLVPTGSQTLPTLSSFATATTVAPTGSAVVATGTLAPTAVVSITQEVPLVVWQPWGAGRVFYMAADPAFAPLKDWTGLEAFYRQLFRTESADVPPWASGLSNWDDAQRALRALPALALPSPYIIGGFLLLYLLAVGPINYGLMRRLKRPEWAWFTTPALVVLFCLLSYLAGYGLRGNRPVLHQLAVVQMWPTAPEARVDQAIGLYSPVRASYDVAFPAETLVKPIADSANPTTPIQLADQVKFKNVWSDIGEVKPFAVQSVIPAPAFEINTTLSYSGAQATLAGTVTNHSDLTLNDVVIIASGIQQRIQSFVPGETLNLSFKFTPGIRDAFADDILTSPNSECTYYYYYSSPDPKCRQYLLLSAAMEDFRSSHSYNVYLVGWSDTAPLNAEVVGQNAATENQTVYFIQIAAAKRPR